uniref:Uncharacterized protein n=1 Tax=Brassica oleracea var. oleracea TaxID=109376 RepID=A0A0D3ANM5_BRAOL
MARLESLTKTIQIHHVHHQIIPQMQNGTLEFEVSVGIPLVFTDAFLMEPWNLRFPSVITYAFPTKPSNQRVSSEMRRDGPPPLTLRRRSRRTSSVTQSTSPASSPVAATTPPAAPTPPAARTPPSVASGPSQSSRGGGLPTTMTVAELVRQPGRESLQRLDPNYLFVTNTTWFDLSGNGITNSLFRMEYTMLKRGYPTFYDMPDEDQELWFRQFAQEFNWESGITELVKIAFRRKAASHYTKRINEWKQKFDVGEVPKHINPDVWLDLCGHWTKDETKSLSTINSQNRCSVRGGKGIFVHNLEATSLQTRALQLVSF